MGGSGSGRDGWRIPVESGLKLDIGYMQRAGLLRPYGSGSLTWTRGEEREYVGAISFSLNEDGLTLTLSYTRGSGEDKQSLNYPVRLLKTPAHFGGFRYWVYCPIVGCKSGKLSKLYLPGGAKYFGCRQCYRLTYESCNESHQFDRLFRSMGQDLGLSAKRVKQALEALK